MDAVEQAKLVHGEGGCPCKSLKGLYILLTWGWYIIFEEPGGTDEWHIHGIAVHIVQDRPGVHKGPLDGSHAVVGGSWARQVHNCKCS